MFRKHLEKIPPRTLGAKMSPISNVMLRSLTNQIWSAAQRMKRVASLYPLDCGLRIGQEQTLAKNKNVMTKVNMATNTKTKPTDNVMDTKLDKTNKRYTALF